jgi:hypothetical protein
LLAAVTLLSVIIIPLAFAVLDVVVGRDTQFSQPFLIKTLATAVVVPMAIGMALRYLAPKFSEGSADVIAKIGVVLLLISVLPILIVLLPAIWSLTGSGMTLAFIVFALAGVIAGYFLGGSDPKERTVLALATTSRHPGIAIALASANVVDETPKQVIAAAVILYLITSTIVVAPFLKWLSRDEPGQHRRSGTAYCHALRTKRYSSALSKAASRKFSVAATPAGLYFSWSRQSIACDVVNELPTLRALEVKSQLRGSDGSRLSSGQRPNLQVAAAGRDPTRRKCRSRVARKSRWTGL